MPTRSLKPCAAPRCPATTSERFCAQHKREHNRRFDANRGTTKERGYAGTWPARRALWLAKNPLCVECERNGEVVAANEVDHIVPKAQDGADDESNYQSLCRHHHSQKTAREVLVK